MPNWFTDTLLAEAVVFILVVTGCFFLGMLDGALEFRWERQLRELEAMSDEEVRDLFLDCSTGGYPFGMVYDEYDKRHKRRMMSQAVHCTLSEQRQVHILSQIMQADEEDLAMLRGNDMCNVAHSATFYVDNTAYMTIPSPYGTVERR